MVEPLYLDGGGDPDLAQIDAYLRAHFNARAVQIGAPRVLWQDEDTVIVAMPRTDREVGLAEVARIMRRHTHDADGRSVVGYYAGRDTTADCLLCRALVKAGVLTLADIGKGTREAILSEKVKVESVEVVDPRVQAAWCLTSCGCDGRRIASECGIHGGCPRCVIR